MSRRGCRRCAGCCARAASLLLSTPHHGPLTMLGLALSPRRFQRHFDPRNDHLRFFSPMTLGRLLDDLGFDVGG